MTDRRIDPDTPEDSGIPGLEDFPLEVPRDQDDRDPVPAVPEARRGDPTAPDGRMGEEPGLMARG